MGHNAILFDLDGTLLNTLEDLADATNRALARFGFPAHELAAYNYFVGDGMRNLILRTLAEDHRDDETVAKTSKAFQEEYARNWADKTVPYDGVPELLDALTERGVPMAILSNKPHEFTKLCVAKLLPGRDFKVVAGVSDVTPKKPDPAGALGVAERLGVPPAEFLYVGDTNTDMQTANAAGMFAVGVTWGFRPASELTANGAKVLIHKPDELLGLL